MNLRENPISWTIEIPLLNNPFILLNVAKAIAITLSILFGVFGTIFFIESGVNGLLSALIPCILLGVFFILASLLTLGVILGNKYPLEFTLDSEGIHMESKSTTAKRTHRLALILGILARSSSVAGAGAAGISGESFYCAWKDIKKVSIYPSKKVVAAKQNAVQTMYVFCTDENFSLISKLVSSKLAEKK